MWHSADHGDEFKMQGEYIQHLDQDHVSANCHHAPELLFGTMIASSNPHRDCPFCPTELVDAVQMQKHVAFHLERIALFSLPPLQEDDGRRSESSARSSAGASSNRVPKYRGRQKSLDLDFPDQNVASPAPITLEGKLILLKFLAPLRITT